MAHGLGWFRDAVASTAQRVATASGNNWVVMGLAIPIPFCPLGRVLDFRCQHELIANFCFDKPEYFDRSTGSAPAYKRVPDSVRRHENQKPVPLLKKLIGFVCPPGGVLLDPFMGIGTVGLACLWTQRNFIGVELNPQHFELAKKLLGALQAQLRTQLGSR